MVPVTHVGVIDIGKTNAKVAVVALESRTEIGVLTRPNAVRPGPPYPHYDVDGLWRFICDSLAELHLAHRIDAISVTTHGASIVLLDAEGGLAVPVLDYEYVGPDRLAADYDAIRPDFSETGSPRLAMGLNVGAQLFWQFRSDPGLCARVAAVLTYPQYWAFRLTGQRACEVTSLGCHTDLWNPHLRCFSPLVERLGLSGKMAPLRMAADCAGTLLPEIARRAGLPEGLTVACGIHDSNASLYPHLLKRKAPFSVVSTGTWVIALSIGGKAFALDPARDTLINVNAFGDPVPSARFMGGREFDLLMGGQPGTCADTEAARVLGERILLLPAVDPRSGPFQGRQSRWSEDETGLSDGERFAAVSFYLALMTAECLAITGAKGPVLVEGPFARNALYLQMLETATGRPVTASEGSATGTSIGAALLVGAASRPPDKGSDPAVAQSGTLRSFPADPAFQAYADAWQRQVHGGR
ncbi:FGGY-family carbohydrate kinase [Roseibium sp. AS2]|uniref:FGGY-family carbohydrate kinase n=1 Tax=Roseibium sp. AS2 TaxID=3135781 RepID=UPI0031741E92